MTEIAAEQPDLGRNKPPVAVPSSPRSVRLRAAAARFWLGALFRLSASAPGLLRAARPLFVRLAYRFSTKIRVSTAANARRIVGPAVPAAQVRSFGLGVVGNFYDFVCDVGRCARASRDDLTARIESVHGLDAYRSARSAGKGAIILTAHLGSFEVGMAALAQHEPRIHVVFKRDAGTFERLRASLRRRLGIHEAAVDEGWTIWMRLRDALQNDDVVAVQGDRVMPGQKGVRVPLLHGHILLPSGPVKLAMASGAPIVPIFSVRTAEGKLRIFIEEPILVAPASSAADDPLMPAMRQIAAVLGKYIGHFPEQWLVLEPAFCEDTAPAPGTGPSNLTANT